MKQVIESIMIGEVISSKLPPIPETLILQWWKPNSGWNCDEYKSETSLLAAVSRNQIVYYRIIRIPGSELKDTK